MFGNLSRSAGNKAINLCIDGDAIILTARTNRAADVIAGTLNSWRNSRGVDGEQRPNIEVKLNNNTIIVSGSDRFNLSKHLQNDILDETAQKQWDESVKNLVPGYNIIDSFAKSPQSITNHS